MELEQRIRDFVRTIDEVADLLTEENAVIESGRLESLAIYQDRKSFLTQLYKRQAQGMADERRAIEQLEPELKGRLEAASMRLATEVARNMRLIEAAERATKRVMDLVVSAARGTVTQGRYPTQEIGRDAARRPSSILSMATNRII